MKRDLPTIEDLAREFPAMSVVKPQIEIERAFRGFATTLGFPSNRPMGIGMALHDLKQRGAAPPSTDRLFEAPRTMNEAAHGFDVDPAATEQAVSIGTEFLAERSRMIS